MYGRLPEVKSLRCSDESSTKRGVGSFELCARLSFAFADPLESTMNEGNGFSDMYSASDGAKATLLAPRLDEDPAPAAFTPYTCSMARVLKQAHAGDG